MGRLSYVKDVQHKQYGTLTYIVNIFGGGYMQMSKPEHWEFRSADFQGPTLNVKTGVFIRREAIGNTWHSLRGCVEGVIKRYNDSAASFNEKAAKLAAKRR